MQKKIIFGFFHHYQEEITNGMKSKYSKDGLWAGSTVEILVEDRVSRPSVFALEVTFCCSKLLKFKCYIYLICYLYSYIYMVLFYFFGKIVIY